MTHTQISPDELACARYLLRDDRAAAQLFRVASSLDSMVVGESEIQGQVRAAWELATEEEASGPMLNRLFRQALEVGKQVRTETRIAAGPTSVSAVAVELAEEVLDDLPGCSVLVIGAGRMAEATALALVRHEVREVVVANRTVGDGARAGRPGRRPRRRLRPAGAGARGGRHRHLLHRRAPRHPAPRRPRAGHGRARRAVPW